MATADKSPLWRVGGRKIFGFVLSLLGLVGLSLAGDHLTDTKVETLMFGVVLLFVALTIPNAIEHLAGALRAKWGAVAPSEEPPLGVD